MVARSPVTATVVAVQLLIGFGHSPFAMVPAKRGVALVLSQSYPVIRAPSSHSAHCNCHLTCLALSSLKAGAPSSILTDTSNVHLNLPLNPAMAYESAVATVVRSSNV